MWRLTNAIVLEFSWSTVGDAVPVAAEPSQETVRLKMSLLKREKTSKQ